MKKIVLLISLLTAMPSHSDEYEDYDQIELMKAYDLTLDIHYKTNAVALITASAHLARLCIKSPLCRARAIAGGRWVIAKAVDVVGTTITMEWFIKNVCKGKTLSDCWSKDL